AAPGDRVSTLAYLACGLALAPKPCRGCHGRGD
ncbi:MAG: hypothetical protein AVDCRST_MAG15-3203, partial [uncultured Rubellimicrobium sp.]